MSTNAAAIERCAHCGTDFPGARMFCPGCGKPNRARDSSPAFSTGSPLQQPMPRAAAVHYPPATGAAQSPRALSYASPLPASAPPQAAGEPMSWEMLLIWSVVSLGIVAAVYAVKQTFWAKRMDPRSTATARLSATSLLPAGATLLMVASTASPQAAPLALVALLLALISPVLGVLYVVTMTQTLRAVAAFNGVPIRPRMLLSFLGGVFYFQHCIRAIELHCSAQRNP